MIKNIPKAFNHNQNSLYIGNITWFLKLKTSIVLIPLGISLIKKNYFLKNKCLSDIQEIICPIECTLALSHE